MGYDILRNFERARRKEKEQEYALERISAEQAPQRAAARSARIEAFDKWNLREKPGPAGAEVFYGKGSAKLTTAVPYSDKYPYHGAERTEAVRTAKLGERPREPAGIAKTRAEAEGIRQSTEFKRSHEDILAGTIKARGREAASIADEAALGVSEMRRDIGRRDEAELIAEEQVRSQRQAQMQMEAEAEAKTKAEAEAAKPGRTINPALKRAWRLSPPGAALYGYKNMMDWLWQGTKEGADWAFPRTK